MFTSSSEVLKLTSLYITFPSPVYNIIVLNISYTFRTTESVGVIIFASIMNHDLESSRGDVKCILFTHIFACNVLYLPS